MNCDCIYHHDNTLKSIQIRYRFFSLLVYLFILSLSLSTSAGNKEKSEKRDEWKFEDLILLPTTPVEDQHRTGTCWSFSTLSLLQSEMIRMGKPQVNLSEMFIVWHTYSEKAKKYVRLHGNLNFSAGGAFHDVTNIIDRQGIVPEEVYKGLKYGEDQHVHGEMDRLLREYVDAVVENTNRKLSTTWHEAFTQIVSSYLGELPQKFEYLGQSYTPLSFANDFVGLNMDDYIEITSYTHHPFYSKFILEIPDNWSWDAMYNVPLTEMEEIMDYALENGYSIAWAADVSEKGFDSGNKGVAVLPAIPEEEMSDAEISRWEALPEKERENELYKLEKPVPELEVTQEMRQIAFDNYQTTDDHGMHIVGMAKDKQGNYYYKVKNSWGDYNHFNGYFYASKPYVRYKTMCIMVHKSAVPPHISKKLNL